MDRKGSKEELFLSVTDTYKEVIAKVCYMYVSADASFDDLYQEVLVNIWQGLDGFRGEAKLSTWIYRAAINTCITWHRRNNRHSRAANMRLDDLTIEPADSGETAEMLEQYQELYRLISRLGPIDKALVTLWLEEKPYDEIGRVMGMTQGAVAVRMHRIKEKLSAMASDLK
ncbi:MAG: sigma-70 family RNA polymerase sigma factor [Muribaculaceae bacterium]|nr:sigma-70 family RNA polymerase sigma factor [Muribaculaceae bacterium]